MLDLVLLKVGDAHFMAVVLLSMGCAAGVLMALMPFLQTDNLARRMKDVSTERERIRMRERERLAAAQSKTSLRYKSGGITKTVTEIAQSRELAEHRHRQATAQPGGLSRRRRRERIPDVPFSRADRVLPCRTDLCVFYRETPMVVHVQGLRRDIRGLPGHQGARDISQQQKGQTSKIDGTGVSEHGRPVDHLRRVGNVDRACRSESEHGDRRRKHRAG